ncbi:MAG: 30S ribosome-binding factor RbfA [Desulfonauticus sp.]|nr:30S ribosome-binding factor RbfA [Desulfonauticus sp.]
MHQKSFKQLRMAEAIKEILSLTLVQDVNDELLTQITITGVQLSPDLKKAKIFYTYFKGENQIIAQKLQKAKGFLRTCLAKKIKTKFIPDLEFVWDQYLDTIIYNQEL